MISKDEFRQKFETEFSKEKQIFKKAKTISIVWFFVATVFVVGACLASYFLSETIAEHWILLVLVGIIVWFALSILPIFQIKDRLIAGFKKIDLAKILKVMYEDDIFYDPSSYIEKSVFQKSEFVEERIDEYSGEDLFCFKVKRQFRGEETSSSIFVSDIIAKQKNYDSNGKSMEKVLFKAMFCSIRFRRPFKCKLDLNSSKKKSLSKLETESTEFNKIFKMQTDNQIESRLILSISFMEKLLKLQEHAKCKIGFSFRDEFLFIYIKKPLFELSKKDDKFNFQLVEPIYDDLKLLEEIATEIENNRKVFKV